MDANVLECTFTPKINKAEQKGMNCKGGIYSGRPQSQRIWNKCKITVIVSRIYHTFYQVDFHFSTEQ